MAWKPEDAQWDNQQNPPAQDAGRRGHWDYTNEGLLLYMLASASPNTDYAIPPTTFYSFRRELGNYGANGNPMVKSWFGSLFVYQYPQAFFNFKDAGNQPLYDREGVDWWQNSIDATIANKQFCNDNKANYAGQEDLWGLTAGYTSRLEYDTYDTYGAPPAGDTTFSTDVHGADGTVFPSAAGGSIAILPDECGRALAKMKELYDKYAYKVWSDDYGFVSSFKMGADLDHTPSPIASFYTGIDLGVMLVMAENNNSGLIWNNFMNAETRYGTMRDLLTQLNFRPNSDPKIYIDL